MSYLKLVLLSLLLAFAASGEPVDCPPRYRQLALPFDEPQRPAPVLRVRDQSTPDMYLVRDSSHEDFEISGLVKGRDLYVSFQTKLKDGTRSELRAKEHFPKIAKHFEGRFDRVMGKWQVGPMTTNLDTFNWLSRTRSPEEAALNTWTGRQAAALGYTKVVFQTLEGRPGRYANVLVAFEKP